MVGDALWVGITPQVAEVECIFLKTCYMGYFCLHVALRVGADVPGQLSRAALFSLRGHGVLGPLRDSCVLKSDLVVLQGGCTSRALECVGDRHTFCSVFSLLLLENRGLSSSSSNTSLASF